MSISNILSVLLLVFAPEASIIRRQFGGIIPHWILTRKDIDSTSKLERGATDTVLEDHSGYIRSVAFSPDGKQAMSGSGDKTVRLWDAGTGTALQILEGHSNWDRSVAFSTAAKGVDSLLQSTARELGTGHQDLNILVGGQAQTGDAYSSDCRGIATGASHQYNSIKVEKGGKGLIRNNY